MNSDLKFPTALFTFRAGIDIVNAFQNYLVQLGSITVAGTAPEITGFPFDPVF